jgi:hypothetical protein
MQYLLETRSNTLLVNYSFFTVKGGEIVAFRPTEREQPILSIALEID